MGSDPSLFFVDSGLGGLPYLDWVKRQLPRARYTYLADNACFPYGDKSADELIDRLHKIASTIQTLRGIDMMVIACNTATVAALSALRESFSFPIVGTVPAVKPASAYGRIAVLATEGTVKAPYLTSLIDEFSSSDDVQTIAAPDLVNFVEGKLAEAEDEEVHALLSPYVDKIKNSGRNAVVLGCTHFIMLRPWLEKGLPKDISIIDSTEGVGKRVLDLIRKYHVSGKPGSGEGQDNLFFLSAEPRNQAYYRSISEKYGMVCEIREIQ